MMVSEVGLIAISSSNWDCPDFVTQATSGEKPAIWFFSLLRAAYETNIGK